MLQIILLLAMANVTNSPLSSSDEVTFYMCGEKYISSHFQKLADNKFVIKFPPFRQILVCLQVLCQ